MDDDNDLGISILNSLSSKVYEDNDEDSKEIGEITGRRYQIGAPVLPIEQAFSVISRTQAADIDPSTPPIDGVNIHYAVGNVKCHNLKKVRFDVKFPNVFVSDEYEVAITPFLAAAIIKTATFIVDVKNKLSTINGPSIINHFAYENDNDFEVADTRVGNIPAYTDFHEEKICDIRCSIDLPFPFMTTCPFPRFLFDDQMKDRVIIESEMILNPKSYVRIRRKSDGKNLTRKEIYKLPSTDINFSFPEILVKMYGAFVLCSSVELEKQIADFGIDNKDSPPTSIIYNFINYIIYKATKKADENSVLIPVNSRNSGTIRETYVVSENINSREENKYFDFNNGNYIGNTRKVTISQSQMKLKTVDYWSGTTPSFRSNRSIPYPRHSGYFCCEFSADSDLPAEIGFPMPSKVHTELLVKTVKGTALEVFVVLQVLRQFAISFNREKQIFCIRLL